MLYIFLYMQENANYIHVLQLFVKFSNLSYIFFFYVLVLAVTVTFIFFIAILIIIAIIV